MLKCAWRLISDCSGAVAPTVALSLVALIAAGGIAFDYARLATMDTELQNAADQAALAAASQLDGEAGACARAAAAAAGLLANETLLANEAASSRAVVVPNEPTCDDDGSIRFYRSYNKATDTFGPEATDDASAKVVLVRVNAREAFYALTPVVGALSSGSIDAEAVASIGSAICKVPPVMMCNPAEPDGNTNASFDFNPPRGAGLRLVIDSPDAPGNFGFLRVDEAGAREVAMQLGYDNPPHGCISADGGIETQPGDMQSVRAAFNTRFDISENGGMTCPGNGVCSPSINSRKDLVRNDACGLSTNTGSDHWHEALIPYRAPNTNPLHETDNRMNGTNAYPETMGFPRDLCHAVSVNGVCSSANGGIVGDGAWDVDAYFWVNYQWPRNVWTTNTGLGSITNVAGVTRYDVYKWEMRPTTPVPASSITRTVSGGFTANARPVCRSPGLDPTATPPETDRRRISVAVVNCEAQNVAGHRTNVQVRKWLDVFLVEPAIARPDRTTNGDIYVEVIEVTSSSSSTNNLPSRRDVPYLIR